MHQIFISDISIDVATLEFNQVSGLSYFTKPNNRLFSERNYVPLRVKFIFEPENITSDKIQKVQRKYYDARTVFRRVIVKKYPDVSCKLVWVTLKYKS